MACRRAVRPPIGCTLQAPVESRAGSLASVATCMNTLCCDECYCVKQCCLCAGEFSTGCDRSPLLLAWKTKKVHGFPWSLLLPSADPTSH